MSYISTEDIDDIGEDIGEAFAPRRRPITPNYQFNRRSYVPPRGLPGIVPTTGQVTSAFEKVGGDVRTLATQVKDIEQSVSSQQGKTSKALAGIRADLSQTKMISALLPMLARPETTAAATESVTIGGIPIEVGSKLVKGRDDTLTMMLPLLLLAGGSNSSEGPHQGGMDNNAMMMFVLVLAMQNKDKK